MLQTATPRIPGKSFGSYGLGLQLNLCQGAKTHEDVHQPRGFLSDRPEQTVGAEAGLALHGVQAITGAYQAHLVKFIVYTSINLILSSPLSPAGV